MSNIIVVDEAHKAAGDVLQQACNVIDEAISEYISILNQVTAEAAKAGRSFDRFNEYKGMISGLKGTFDTMGGVLKSTTETFVAEIDAADRYLY